MFARINGLGLDAWISHCICRDLVADLSSVAESNEPFTVAHIFTVSREFSSLSSLVILHHCCPSTMTSVPTPYRPSYFPQGCGCGLLFSPAFHEPRLFLRVAQHRARVLTCPILSYTSGTPCITAVQGTEE